MAVTLIVAVSMTQVMIRSDTNPLDQPGMMEALSEKFAQGVGSALPFIVPWLGALGAFMTGSRLTRISSSVFCSTMPPPDVDVSRTLVVALQNVGSGIGNMTSILNITAICGVLGMTGMEGSLLRKTIIPTIIYAIFAGLAGLTLSYFVSGLY